MLVLHCVTFLKLMYCLMASILFLNSAHVGDHGANVTHDGGEDEDTNEEIKGDEQVLHVLLWLGGLPYGGEGQGGPVEAVDVLRGE